MGLRERLDGSILLSEWRMPQHERRIPSRLCAMRARPVGDTSLFAGVTSIQRVKANGGAATSTGCNADAVGSDDVS